MIRIPGRIPIEIHPIFWIVALLIGWMNSEAIPQSITWAIVIFISVLFHEFGHALTGLAFNQKVQIELVGLGGVTKRDGPKLKLWQEFLIVMNGPCAGFLLYFIAYKLRTALHLQNVPMVAYGLQIGVYINLVWTILNLIPVLPLDGGKLLSIIMEGIFGFKGIKFAIALSLLISVSLGIFFFVIQAMFAGMLFFFLAFESYRTWETAKTMTVDDRNESLLNLLKSAETNLLLDKKQIAMQQFEEVREKSKAGIIYIRATQHLADLLCETGRFQSVYELLAPIKKEINVDSLRLLHQTAYRTGKFEEAVAIGDKVHQTLPNYDTALVNALCYALLNKAKPSIGWLKCSLSEGLPNLGDVLSRRDFDLIRDNPVFQDFVKGTKGT